MNSYMNLILSVKSLSDWKSVVLEVRGPYPTMDSEIVLMKMIGDIIKVNQNMKKLEYSMVDIINCNNLTNVLINGNIWSMVYDNPNDIEMSEI